MKRNLLILMAVVCLACSSIHAQTKTKTKKKPVIGSELVTNATITDLNKAGLDKDVIIDKINNSETSFDVSSDALIALKNQKVDNEVIRAMINKGNGSKKAALITTMAKPAPATTLPRLDMVNQVYRYNPQNNAVSPLEKTVATMKTKTKMFGYGGASVIYTVEGDKSGTRIMATDSVAFVIDAGGGAPPDMSLYKLTISKGNRQATTQNISGTFKAMSGNVMSGGAIIPFNIVRGSENVYKIIPSKPLDKGEYFFAIKPVALSSSVDVYAFGID